MGCVAKRAHISPLSTVSHEPSACMAARPATSFAGHSSAGNGCRQPPLQVSVPGGHHAVSMSTADEPSGGEGGGGEGGGGEGGGGEGGGWGTLAMTSAVSSDAIYIGG